MTKNLFTIAALVFSLAVPATVTFAADKAAADAPAAAAAPVKRKKMGKKKAAVVAPAADATKK